MKISDIDLLALMPRFMRDDPVTQAICAALQPDMQIAADAAKYLFDALLIDNAPEWRLDQMAIERHVTWYSIEADIQAKRSVLKRAPWVQRHLGTKAAVETTVHDYFGNAALEEWFEYDGLPYHFRVITTLEAANEKAYLFRNAVENTKNVRSYLEAIIAIISADQGEYIATAMSSLEYQTIKIRGLEGQYQHMGAAVDSLQYMTINVPGLEEAYGGI